jgi:signal transduction histidine kinase
VRQKQTDPGPDRGPDAGFSPFGPADGDPGRSPAPEPPGSGSRLSFRNWRVPTRLAAILVVPMAGIIVFAGLRINDQLSSASQAQANEHLAVLVRDTTTAVDLLERERDISVQPLMNGDTGNAQVAAARKATDQAIATMYADASQVTGNHQVSVDLAEFRAIAAGKGTMTVSGKAVPVPGLADLRAAAYKALPPQETQLAYSAYFWPLMGVDNELAFGSNQVNSRGRELYALTLAKASYSTERNLVQIGLVRGKMTAEEAIGLQVANKLTETAITQFTVGGIAEDIALYNRTVQSPQITQADQVETGIGLLGLAGRPLSAAHVTPDMWLQLSDSRINLERQVELQITDQIVADAQSAKTSAERQALIQGSLALLGLLIAILIAGLFARSMVRGMRTLRNSAQEVAQQRLPELVERLSKTDPERVDTRITPIPLSGRDEIGEVARAFDEVHREAVRLAAEQALLRGNVNAIFTNLSRRSQGLIERQLALITDLENNEADPEQLENLFKLDHLATRMRRNGENLLVLSGEEGGRQWSEPIPLVDVLRAAASEVEQYERVELAGIPETEVVGPAVTDLVHLLAELLENATTFSSPQTRVRVTATRLPDQRVLVEIHDKGIGLGAEDFAEINAKLASPPVVDASVSRQMGLYVVGRLAMRHGVRVQLRPSGESAGTTSLVMLPESLTQLPHQRQPEERFTVSRIVGDTEVPTFDPTGAGQRTAGELGFDDSRYARQGESAPAGALDSVQRSLRIGQRRGVGAGAEAVELPSQPQPAELESGRNAAALAAEAFPTTPTAPQAPESGYGDYRPAAEFDNGYQGGDFGGAYHQDQGQNQGYQDGGYQNSGYQNEGYQGGGYDTGSYGRPAAYSEPAGYQAPPPGYDPAQGLRETFQNEFEAGPYPAQHHAGDRLRAEQSRQPAAPEPPPAAQQPRSGRSYGLEEFEAAAREAKAAQERAASAANARPAAFESETPESSEFGYETRQPYYGRPEPTAGDRLPAAEAAPPAPAVQPPSTGGLPTRRPGQAISGRAIGDRSTGERLNWFTGAREAPEAGSGGNAAPATRQEGAGWQTPNGASWRPEEPTPAPDPTQSAGSAWTGVKAGEAAGTTAAGLPRRVPRQNLVPGQAPESTPGTGPQLSRAPEEVRGRLSELRRGVQQGRTAQSTEQHSTDLFGGPHHQER